MTYLNSCPRPYCLPGSQDDPGHDWEYFTARRLIWLYGPNHATERAAMTQADIAAWRRLGERSAA